MLNEEGLINCILSKTIIYPEPIQKMSEIQVKIESMTQQRLFLTEQISNDFTRYKHISNRKEFTKTISDRSYKSVLFALYDAKDISDKLTWSKVERWL